MDPKVLAWAGGDVGKTNRVEPTTPRLAALR
jgi:hypothetical protein